MKATLIFLAVAFAVAYAQFNLVAHQVHAIIAANEGITVDECVNKCDDAFMLVDVEDEIINDHKCSQECDCNKKDYGGDVVNITPATFTSQDFT